eukprot:CAMPEP_0115211418 /NCGR_PEP_ID=MMETSP0270-20121206/22754_1 /TAXON_ID=71861 /ORGANISM="Scrippsiella trochoidea, Strain CCMP3099" /LENGTH=527 /DNA_ID=CAMNT_0002625107 /DNA_START=32 /DNA_END=1615 /DNA_ORIENTATION=-
MKGKSEPMGSLDCDAWAAAVARLAPSGNAGGAPPLEPGVCVRIGDFAFQVVGLLGEGSFGAVWSAVSGQRAGEVAIKEIICRSETELLRAATERHLLQFVGRGGQAGDEDSPAVVASRRFPSLVASEVEALGPDLWQVRLAMSRLAGKPLESLLDNWCSQPLDDLTQIPMSVDQGGNLVDTSRCVRCMLQQLVPALEHLGTRAHHRDITPRNILVEKKGSDYSFGLVDFGLAVDASKWKAELLTHDIGGDGHYWPTSSWFVLEYGAHHLGSYPALWQEYESCLDMHALGVSALRCLMERWSPEAQGPDSASGSRQVAKLWRLRLAWTRFWDDIARFWQPIFDAFACGGCNTLESLKSQYAHAGVHHMVSANLCAVRAALRELRAVADVQDLRVVCDALLLLVRPGKLRDDSPTWQNVRIVLSGHSRTSPVVAERRSSDEGRRHWMSTNKEAPVHKAMSHSWVNDPRGWAPASACCDAAATPMASATATQSTHSPAGSIWSSASVRSSQLSPAGSAVLTKPAPLVRVG